MISQSKRAISAREGRYRINRPNSKGRHTKVLSLDDAGRNILAELAGFDWQGSDFIAVGETQCLPLRPADSEVSGLSLDQALAGADVVVLVVTSATDVAQVVRVGRYCSQHRIMTTGFVLDDPANPALKPILTAVRSCVVSLVLESDRDSLIECLRALRA